MKIEQEIITPNIQHRSLLAEGVQWVASPAPRAAGGIHGGVLIATVAKDFYRYNIELTEWEARTLFEFLEDHFYTGKPVEQKPPPATTEGGLR